MGRYVWYMLKVGECFGLASLLESRRKWQGCLTLLVCLENIEMERMLLIWWSRCKILKLWRLVSICWCTPLTLKTRRMSSICRPPWKDLSCSCLPSLSGVCCWCFTEAFPSVQFAVASCSCRLNPPSTMLFALFAGCSSCYHIALSHKPKPRFCSRHLLSLSTHPQYLRPW